MNAITSIAKTCRNQDTKRPGLRVSEDLGTRHAEITHGVNEIIGGRPISEVWVALGGDPPKRVRARAFNRNGDNPFAVALDDAKGCWFDHRDGVGGGVLDLVQRVQGGTRRSALSWLAELNGVRLDDHRFTEAERRRYARQRAEASDLSAWKERLVEALKRERERWWRIYHGTLRYVLGSGLEAPLGTVAADLNELSEVRIEVLNWQVGTLKAATISDLLPVFQAQRRRAAE